jgi:hypothetical protein
MGKIKLKSGNFDLLVFLTGGFDDDFLSSVQLWLMRIFERRMGSRITTLSRPQILVIRYPNSLSLK